MMNERTVRRVVVWILMALTAFGIVACESSEDRPVAGNLEGNVTAEAEPGEVVTVESRPTEVVTLSQQKGLEDIGGGYIYRREGGIAGFCDVVTVLAGTATVATCAQDPPPIVAELTLTLEQSQQVNTWIEALAPFEYEQKDNAVSDSMVVVISFEGQGDGEETPEIIAAMEALALDLLNASREP